MPTPMNEAEIRTALGNVPSWKLEGKEIRRVLTFDDFAAAMVFVNKVAEAAEEANHHPDITINYNRVTLALCSHDAGGLTHRDFKMAHTIDCMMSTSDAFAEAQ